MKRFRFLLILPLLFSLLLYASATLSAARHALSLWWESVLPALLPFLIGCGLLSRLLPPPAGARALVPAFLAGAVCGYPTGGKLLGDLVRRGALRPREAGRAALCFNLPSPVFLLSIIACGMFQSKAFFLPLAVCCYLPPLLLLPFLRLTVAPVPDAFQTQPPLSLAVTDAITDGVTGILRIGGCIVTACVLTALAREAGLLGLLVKTGLPASVAEAGAAGLLEMTVGSALAAAAALSLRWRLTLCAFFVSFGGLSVFLQTSCFLPFDRPLSYLLGKLGLGLASGLLLYLTFPLYRLPPSALPVLAQGGAYLQRAAATGALLGSAAVSLAFVLLFCLVGGKTAEPCVPKKAGSDRLSL